jgi:hypothetical protein
MQKIDTVNINMYTIKQIIKPQHIVINKSNGSLQSNEHLHKVLWTLEHLVFCSFILTILPNIHEKIKIIDIDIILQLSVQNL